MKISYIVPHPGDTSPNRVLFSILLGMKLKGVSVTLFYLKPAKTNIFEELCEVSRLNFFNRTIVNKIASSDLIHSQGFIADVISVFFRGTLSIKTLTTVHSILKQDLTDSKGVFIGKWMSFFWYCMLRRFDSVVCLNDYSRLDIKRHASCDAVVIPNGIEPRASLYVEDSTVVDKIKAIRLEGKKILIASAVVRKLKGFEFVLDSIKKREDFVFVLIGDGDYLAHLRAKFAEQIESGQFLPLGFLNHPYIYYKYADVFIMSSYFEGFPMSLLEAVRERIPVACVDERCFKGVFSSDEVSYFYRETTEFLSAVDTALRNVKQINRASLAINTRYSVQQQQSAYYNHYVNLVTTD